MEEEGRGEAGGVNNGINHNDDDDDDDGVFSRGPCSQARAESHPWRARRPRATCPRGPHQWLAT
eukprot:9491237-Pyramimonas_sp.AAC.3